jgi:hypothetical protein
MGTWCGQGRRGNLGVLFRVGSDFTAVGDGKMFTSRIIRVGNGRGNRRRCFASGRILEKSYLFRFLHFLLRSFFVVIVFVINSRRGVPFVAPVVTVVPFRMYRNNITWCIATWIRPSRSRVGVLGIHLGTSSRCASSVCCPKVVEDLG